jgi:hypothetical protein
MSNERASGQPRWEAAINDDEIIVQESPGGGADWWTGGLEVKRERHGLTIREFDRQRMVALSATETLRLLEHLQRHEQRLRAMAEAEAEALKSQVLQTRQAGS